MRSELPIYSEFLRVYWEQSGYFQDPALENLVFRDTSCSFLATISLKYPKGRKQPSMGGNSWISEWNWTREKEYGSGEFDGINDPVPVFGFHSNLSVSMLPNIDRFGTRINHLCLLLGTERVRVVSDIRVMGIFLSKPRMKGVGGGNCTKFG